MVTGKGRYFWSMWPRCRHFIKRHHWADVETAQQTVMEDWLLKEKVNVVSTPVADGDLIGIAIIRKD